MITQVTETDFIDAFKAIRPDNFTYNGLKALYAFLEEVADDTGEEIQFDVIGICCDFVEYKNWADFINDYGSDFDLPKRKQSCSNSSFSRSYWNEKRHDSLNDHTIVIPISEEFTGMDINGIMSSNKEGFIIQAF